MAAIESIAGITKDTARDGFYTVTDRVFIGAGIDDVYDATFYIDSGFLRWAAGCTTTFTNCTFIEGIDCDRIGNGNNYSGMPRWEAISTCAPIFKACMWIIEHTVGDNALNPLDINPDTGRGPDTVKSGHDWDVSDSTSCQFIRNDEGEPCRVIYHNYTTGTEPRKYQGGDSWYTKGMIYNSALSRVGNLVIDGLIFDSYGCPFNIGARTSTVDIKDMIIVDRDADYADYAYDQTHVNVDMNGLFYTVYDPVLDKAIIEIIGLSARNVGTYFNNYTATGTPIYRNPNCYVKLINSVGELGNAVQKNGIPNDNQRGKLSNYRTLDVDFYSPYEDTTVEDVRCVVVNNITEEKITDTVVTNFSTTLHHFTQDWDTYDKTYDNQYRLAFGKYGYNLSKQSLVVEAIDAPVGYTLAKTLLLIDEAITQRDEATVAGYTEIFSASSLYDYSQYFQFKRDELFTTNSENIMTRTGSSLSLNGLSLIVDPSLSEVMYWNQSDVDAELVYIEGAQYPDPQSLDNFSQGNQGSFDLNTLASLAGLSAVTIISDFNWSSDGTYGVVSMFEGTWRFATFSLSTPYDFSTASFVSITPAGQWYLPSVDTDMPSCALTTDGVFLLISKYGATNVYMMKTNVPYNFTTPGGGVYYPNTGNLYRSQLTIADANTLYINVKGYLPYNAAGIHKVTFATANTPNVQTDYDNADKLLVAAGDLDNTLLANTSYGPLVLRQEANTLLQFANNASFPANTGINWQSNISAQDTTYENISTSDLLGFSTLTPNMNFATTSIIMMRADGNDNIYLLNTSGTITKYSYPQFIQLAGYVGGQANTLYVKATNIIADQGVSTLLVDGYATFNNASTGMTVSDATGTLTNLTIAGINPGTEIRIYDANTDEEVLGIENSVGTQASFNYVFVQPQDWYIILHNTQYVTSPSRLDFTTQLAPAFLTVFQSIDRAFRNP